MSGMSVRCEAGGLVDIRDIIKLTRQDLVQSYGYEDGDFGLRVAGPHESCSHFASYEYSYASKEFNWKFNVSALIKEINDPNSKLRDPINPRRFCLKFIAAKSIQNWHYEAAGSQAGEERHSYAGYMEAQRVLEYYFNPLDIPAVSVALKIAEQAGRDETTV